MAGMLTTSLKSYPLHTAYIPCRSAIFNYSSITTLDDSSTNSKISGSAVNGGQEGLYCYGVTWLWYAGGVNSLRCLLKTQGGLNQSVENDMLAVSAVLLTGVPLPVLAAY